MTLQDKKILIVYDDKRLRALLKSFLTEEGFLVDCAVDAEQMTLCLKRSYYDLILLDWKLPGEDGLSVCKRLKSDNKTPPILMLTANGSENDCISCLKCGADDYLAKPFNPDVLLARINAVLRRRPRIVASAPDDNPLLFYFGPYSLDSIQRCLYQDGNRIDLTSNEFALLNVLAQHLGKALSREQLSYLIKGQDLAPENRFIDVQICRLRRLLEKNPTNPTYLQTVRGVGYVLVKPSTMQ
ncbi:MAG: hypothetical protein RLZ75_1038 [Pseudomonadota bacterium]